MTAAEYTPATVAEIRSALSSKVPWWEVARSLEWDAARLGRVCARHMISLKGVPPKGFFANGSAGLGVAIPQPAAVIEIPLRESFHRPRSARSEARAAALARALNSRTCSVEAGPLLFAAVTARAKKLGCSKTQFMVSAVVAALNGARPLHTFDEEHHATRSLTMLMTPAQFNAVTQAAIAARMGRGQWVRAVLHAAVAAEEVAA